MPPPAAKRRFAYCATKGAVVALSRQLAIDYAGRLRVNCVCPGTVETPFAEAFPEEFHKHVIRRRAGRNCTRASRSGGWTVRRKWPTWCLTNARRKPGSRPGRR